jgi:hypothetical protein
MRPRPAEQAHGMESRPAAGTAVGTNQKDSGGGVPESDGAGRANLEGAALETLRNLPASNEANDQEREGEEGDKNGSGLKQVKHVTHGPVRSKKASKVGSARGG